MMGGGVTEVPDGQRERRTDEKLGLTILLLLKSDGGGGEAPHETNVDGPAAGLPPAPVLPSLPCLEGN